MAALSWVDIAVFCNIRESSAMLALVFLQASTSVQTVIHAGPRQRDVTRRQKKKNVKKKNHTYNASLTPMNESLVRVVLTLALESLFPKPPVKTKKVSFVNSAAVEMD